MDSSARSSSSSTARFSFARSVSISSLRLIIFCLYCTRSVASAWLPRTTLASVRTSLDSLSLRRSVSSLFVTAMRAISASWASMGIVRATVMLETPPVACAPTGFETPDAEEPALAALMLFRVVGRNSGVDTDGATAAGAGS